MGSSYNQQSNRAKSFLQSHLSSSLGLLPLPQLPWQQRNIWERTPEQSIKPGGRPIPCPQQSGPAHSTPPGQTPFKNSHLLPCIQEAKIALTQPLTLTCSHFSSIASLFTSFHPLCPPLSVPAWPDNAPSPEATLCMGQRDCWGARMGAGAYLVSMLNSEQGRQTLSRDLLSRPRCHMATACLK